MVRLASGRAYHMGARPQVGHHHGILSNHVGLDTVRLTVTAVQLTVGYGYG